MPRFGLIGKSLSHSFSKKYFTAKFEKEKRIGYFYDLFPLDKIDDIQSLVKNYPDLLGLNVTIPYKTSVIPFLNKVHSVASITGAVNTVVIQRKTNDIQLIGFNTDVIGFELSLNEFLKGEVVSALILGNGGSAKAVAYVLNKQNIPYLIITRNPKEINELNYEAIDASLIASHKLIINCTPLGTFPQEFQFPAIPYQYLTTSHYLFDLVYNPEETAFLKKGKEKGCRVTNGLQMLYYQADAAFDKWLENKG